MTIIQARTTYIEWTEHAILPETRTIIFNLENHIMTAKSKFQTFFLDKLSSLE
jgi:hypothetical protein